MKKVIKLLKAEKKKQQNIISNADYLFANVSTLVPRYKKELKYNKKKALEIILQIDNAINILSGEISGLNQKSNAEQ